MLNNNKKINKNSKFVEEPEIDTTNEQGFITMVIMMLLILGVVIYLAYKRVSGA